VKLRFGSRRALLSITGTNGHRLALILKMRPGPRMGPSPPLTAQRVCGPLLNLAPTRPSLKRTGPSVA
jgi:hypothetical protein